MFYMFVAVAKTYDIEEAFHTLPGRIGHQVSIKFKRVPRITEKKILLRDYLLYFTAQPELASKWHLPLQCWDYLEV